MKKIWNPTDTFFKSGKTFFEDGTLITWEFTLLSPSHIPLQILKCKIKGFGLTAEGFGDGLSLRGAAIRAFGEAWERLWLVRYQEGGISLPFKIFSSSGFAAGPSDEKAIQSSKNELIERAVMLEAWQSQKGWQPNVAKSFMSKILLAYLETQGWTSQLFTLDAALSGDVHIIISRHKDRGMRMDSSFSTQGRSTEFQLAKSILRSHMCPQAEAINELPEFGGPADHDRFYSNPNHLQAFDFLETPSSQKGCIELPEPNKTTSHILASCGNLPAVAVSFHPDWKVISWGKQSIQGVNPWPHPLA